MEAKKLRELTDTIEKTKSLIIELSSKGTPLSKDEVLAVHETKEYFQKAYEQLNREIDSGKLSYEDTKLYEKINYTEVYQMIEGLESLLKRAAKENGLERKSETLPQSSENPQTNSIISPPAEKPKENKEEGDKNNPQRTDNTPKEIDNGIDTGKSSLSPMDKTGTKETLSTKSQRGFFTTTNILILALLLGAGVYFYSQKK